MVDDQHSESWLAFILFMLLCSCTVLVDIESRRLSESTEYQVYLRNYALLPSISL